MGWKTPTLTKIDRDRAARGVTGFPSGARVLVDGRDEAIVGAHFPEGSTFRLYPHYQLRWPNASPGEYFYVPISRVGVKRAKKA